MKIERFKNGEESKTSKLIIECFNKCVAQEFLTEGIKKFHQHFSPEQILERSKARDIYTAKINGKIIGVIHAKNNNHISSLFIDPKYHRQGIGKKLIEKIETIYKKKGSKKLTVWSSSYAVKFYEKQGFKKSRGLVKKKGFIYQPMRKILD